MMVQSLILTNKPFPFVQTSWLAESSANPEFYARPSLARNSKNNLPLPKRRKQQHIEGEGEKSASNAFGFVFFLECGTWP